MFILTKNVIINKQTYIKSIIGISDDKSKLESSMQNALKNELLIHNVYVSGDHNVENLNLSLRNITKSDMDLVETFYNIQTYNVE